MAHEDFSRDAVLALANPWGLDLSLLRSDAQGAHLGGNKYHKLRGYLGALRSENMSHWITMAGARSNHLRAFAALTQREQLQATAIIRGDELADERRQSAEIRLALESGVRCLFVPRAVYRQLREIETTAERDALLPAANFPGSLFVPEGGLGLPGLEGVKDWARAAAGFDTVWLPCATGMTAVGFLAATKPPTLVRGVAVLDNASAIQNAVLRFAPGDAARFELLSGGAAGFAKTTPELEQIAAEYSEKWGLVIDTVYLAKTVLALQTAALSGGLTGRHLLVYTYNE